MKKLLFYTCCLLLFSCNTNKKNDTGSIYQLSYSHGDLDRDSIVLHNKNEIENYSEISIYRRSKLIFKDTDKNLEVVGMNYSLFVEQEIIGYKEYYYIFKLFNAPDPENYLIIKTTPDTTFVFGETEPCTAEIFGDIDGDGKFEIGGWVDYCEEDETHKCPDTSLFKVFKIDKGFPIDTALTNFFRRAILKKAAESREAEGVPK